MSREFATDVRGSFTLDALAQRAQAIEAELVGLTGVPEPRVVIGRRRQLGRLVDDGRGADPATMAAVTVGARAADPQVEVTDTSGGTITLLTVSHFDGEARLTWEFRRDAEGLVIGLSFTLASASLGEGRLIDMDIGIVDGGVADPEAWIARTRLVAAERKFPDACDAYLAQFPQARL